MKKRILFVSHAASRSGAPKILLGIVKEFSTHAEWDVQVICMEDGPLVQDFKSMARTFVWYHTPAYVLAARTGIGRFADKLYYKLKGWFILINTRKCDIVLLNTITNGDVHAKLLGKARNFITYVHELDTAVRSNTNSRGLACTLANSSFFLAGSLAVQEMLRQKLGVDEEKIKVLYSSLAGDNNSPQSDVLPVKAFKEANRIPEGAFITAAVGTAEWRKGFDWWFPLVKIYLKKYPNGRAFFIWKGVDYSSRQYREQLFDIEKSGLTHRVLMLPHGSDVDLLMASLDVHLLLSREDPFPMVVLESAALGIPTVSFKDAGGSPEFIESDAGISVEYGDLDGFADAIIKMEKHVELRQEMGARAKAKSGRYRSTEAGSIVMKIANELISSVQS